MLSRMRFEASSAFDALETKVKARAYPFLT
jgi:hypothetical protein